MATRTIANGGGNWSATGTWVEGVVPTSADAVVATATSGNLTVDTAAATCLSIDFTNYVGTLAMNNTLTVNGNVTLVSAMSITGSNKMSIVGASTITSNGKQWSPPMEFNGTATKTLVGNFTITGLLTLTGITTLNKTTSETLTCSAGIAVNAPISGTAKIIATGGSLGGSSNKIQNSLDLNGNITIVSGLQWGGPNTSLTYISGTITVAGNFQILTTTGATLDVGGIIWNDLYLAADLNTNSSYTLNSDLNVSGVMNIGITSLTVTCTVNGSRINCFGGLNVTPGGGSITGTTTLNICGGTVTGSATGGQLKLNTVVNSSIIAASSYGTMAIGSVITWANATIAFGTGELRYTYGVMVFTSGCTLRLVSSCTITNAHYFKFTNVTITAGITVTTDKFFYGSTHNICTIQSGTAGSTYTVAMLGKFASLFVKISDAVFSLYPLMVPFSLGNKGNNRGVIFDSAKNMHGFPMAEVTPVETEYGFAQQGLRSWPLGS